MKYDIIGSNLQVAILEIEPNELVYSEAGAMVYMSENVSMQAKARGGLMKGLKRMLSKETFFLTEYWSTGGTGVVGFGGNIPGKIIPLDLRGGRQYLAQKDAFLAAENSVEMDIAFQKKLGSMFFGGEGLILQRYWGEGTVFIHACGDMVEMNLEAGQAIKVDTGNAVAWEASVSYDIQKAGGIKTMLFGGEGLFLTRLTGPGKVILQSMTLANLAGAIVPFLPSGGTSGSSLVGGLLRG
ncbi:MAG: TIGR00266 family protein [Thermoplasmata archaeon]|nr:TIGR00266 family protein [Thermoplasmata archaeon]